MHRNLLEDSPHWVLLNDRRLTLNLLKSVLVAVLLLSTTASYAVNVTLGWNANPPSDQVTSYSIYYKVGASSGPPYDGSGALDGPSPVIVPVDELADPEDPQYTIHGLSEGKIYLFAVTATNVNGEGDYSSEVSNDEDLDGMADHWEIAYFGDLSHDGTGDSDSDGLTDLEEFQNKTYPTNPDSDGDGFKDGDEVAAGTDPNDPQSRPSSAMPWIPLLLLDD